MVMPSRERWTAMWRSFGAEEPHRLYDELMARYAEPHRHYHTAQHLDECLALYDEIGAVADLRHRALPRAARGPGAREPRSLPRAAARAIIAGWKLPSRTGSTTACGW